MNIAGIDLGLFATPLTLASQSATKLVDVFRDTAFQITSSRVVVQGLIADLNKVGGPTKLNETVVQLQAMADKFSQGDEKSKQFAESLKGLIKQLQTAGETNVEGKFNIVIPPDVLSGKVGADAGNATAAGFASALRSKDVGFGAFLQGLNGPAETAGSEAGKLFGAGFKAAVSVSVSEAAQSALDLALAQASGNEQQELSVLIKRRQRQQEFLDRVLARKPTTSKEATKNTALATQAAKNLADTKQSISTIFDQRATATKQAASDAAAKTKKAADDAQKQLTAADQAVLDAFVPKQNRLDLRAIQTGGSENLKAQLALQVAIANQASREIAIIDKTVKDQKTHDAEIAARVKTLATSGVNITSLLKQIGAKAKDRAAAALQAVLDLDQARLQLAQLRARPRRAGQGRCRGGV